MISSKVKYSPPCRSDNRKSIIARGKGICQNIENAAKADLLEVNNKSAFFIYNQKYQNREEDSPFAKSCPAVTIQVVLCAMAISWQTKADGTSEINRSWI